ncbi:MAG: prephenate dehydrogenase/arogenate dehydrogenase family protein [Synergistaceae bacterium]|nr:prephenate dehydrogenase/arogenate dehydrogenase family protein [Synergistaceae bacterium]
MIVGIIGLGLIGGSLAKSIKTKTLHNVIAFDIDTSTMTMAKLCGAVDEELTDENLSQCDLLFLAVSPSNAVEWIENHAENLTNKSVVIDLCGVKRVVCEKIYPLAHKRGFIFIGGHPMAGRERSGFVNSTAELFDGASMILTPELENGLSIDILEKLKAFFVDVGFSSVTFTSPEEHDRIIAYTSQLAHVISSAYVKSPDAVKRRGFSAGSFRDMTRVARLDEKLWTELFLSNRDFLIEQIEIIMKNINEYLSAIKDNDADKLEKLLREGREMKALAGGN